MSKTILTVDDSESIRRMLSATLSSAGYHVVQAGDGHEALEKAKSIAAQLIITDQNMPVMHGLELVRSLRAIPQYSKTPILILTTESGDAMKAQGKAAGANGWLVKPFDPQTLLHVVKKVLG
jgi:two-component system, chemotaxis family, chemotaxis protein CheY